MDNNKTLEDLMVRKKQIDDRLLQLKSVLLRGRRDTKIIVEFDELVKELYDIDDKIRFINCEDAIDKIENRRQAIVGLIINKLMTPVFN